MYREYETYDKNAVIFIYGLQSGQFKNTLLYIVGSLVCAWTYLVISCRPSIRLGMVCKKASSPSSKLKIGVSPRLKGNSPMPGVGAEGFWGWKILIVYNKISLSYDYDESSSIVNVLSAKWTNFIAQPSMTFLKPSLHKELKISDWNLPPILRGQYLANFYVAVPIKVRWGRQKSPSSGKRASFQNRFEVSLQKSGVHNLLLFGRLVGL